MFHAHRRVGILAVAAVAVAALIGVSATANAETTATYHEPYRPQFHYTLPAGWIGDPNGLVYDHGLYYLYSFGTWQGAVSRDLVHWTNIPVTGPAPDPGSNAFYSGSAVVDTNNTSGLGKPGHPAMVAFYTSVQQTTGVQAQSMAYSTDEGRTWTRYSGNPVIDLNSTNFRDPKVFWYAPGREWLMAVALSDQYKVSFYTSPNLKTWTHTGDFGPAGATTGVWEMPDLYQLPVDGKPDKTKWVLSVSVGSTGVQYFTGQFNGSVFTPDGPASYTPPAGTALEDFDSGGYGDWSSTRTAFGTAPAQGALPNQQQVTGYTGDYLANSYNGGDASTGTLTSPSFTINAQHLNFLIGGGNNPYVAGAQPFGTLPAGTVFTDFSATSASGAPEYDPGWTETGDFTGTAPSHEQLGNQVSAGVLDTYGGNTTGGDANEGTVTSPTFTIDSPYIDLQVAGGEHPNAQANPTAVNLLVGGQVVATATGNNSGTLTWTNWDTSAYQGRQAQIQVVDENDGSTGWGHLMVGDIIFATQKASPWDTQTAVNLIVDGKVVRTATGADSENLDWASWDLADLQGKQAKIQIVDHATGSWGHVLADAFTLSSQPALNQVQRASWLDYGADFYAENTWNDTPGGQRIAIAWMNNWAYANQVPTTPWQGSETFPRTLSLRTIDGKTQIVEQPVTGLASLRTGTAYQARNLRIANSSTQLKVNGRTLEIQAHFTKGTATSFGLNVHTGADQYTQIGYDTTTGELYIDRSHSGDVDFSSAFTGRNSAPLALTTGGLTLHILVDSSSVEVFGDRGQAVLTEQILPAEGSNGVSVFADGGTATVDTVQVQHLRSIWK